MLRIITHEFICENDMQAKTELHTSLSSVGDLRATPHPFAAQQFQKLSDIALICLSVPCNSIAAERSFSLHSDGETTDVALRVKP